MKTTTKLTRQETIDRILKANELKASKEAERKKGLQEIDNHFETRETTLRAFQSLTRYLGDHTLKTEVTNQLKEIGTPDAMKVVEAVDDLHKTLKTHENVDLSGMTKLLDQILKEAKAIPKDHKDIEIPEQVTVSNMPKPIDYAERFKSLETKMDRFIDLATKIEAKKTIVEAPTVNIETDVKPLANEVKKFDKSITKLKEGQADVQDGHMQTMDVSSLVTDRYNNFEMIYFIDEFASLDEEKKLSGVKYYMDKKLVGQLSFKYSGGDLKKVSYASNS